MKDYTSRLFSTLSYSFITVHRLIIHRVLWVCQVFFSGENFFDHLGVFFSGEFFLEGFFWGIFSGEFFGDVSLCGSWRTYWRAGNFFFGGCVFVRWYGQAPVWTQNVPTGFYWCLSSEKNPAVPLDTAGSGVLGDGSPSHADQGRTSPVPDECLTICRPCLNRHFPGWRFDSLTNPDHQSIGWH